VDVPFRPIGHSKVGVSANREPFQCTAWMKLDYVGSLNEQLTDYLE
jgi:hypothetical protein